MFTVAIIGRPNVGKSTLFNRLVGRRLALVDDSPGVTRDIREGLVSRGKFACRVLDTAGVGDPGADGLGQAMISFALNAAETADVCLFTVDARAGVTALDQELAASLRRTTHRLLLLANKAEGSTVHSGVNEFFALGLGEPLAISAEHGTESTNYSHACRKSWMNLMRFRLPGTITGATWMYRSRRTLNRLESIGRSGFRS